MCTYGSVRAGAACPGYSVYDCDDTYILQKTSRSNQGEPKARRFDSRTKKFPKQIKDGAFAENRSGLPLGQCR